VAGRQVWCAEAECQDTSGYCADDQAAELWALRHTDELGWHHSQFEVHMVAYWAVIPRGTAGSYGDVWGASQVVGDVADAGTLLLRPVRSRGSRVHARPRWRGLRGWWRRWVGGSSRPAAKGAAVDG